MLERIRANLDKEPMTQNVMNLFKEGKTHHSCTQDGLLVSKGNRFFVSKVSGLKKALLTTQDVDVNEP